MTTTKLSKVVFNKSTTSLDFATEEYLFDFLEMVRAKSNLPIKKMLAMLANKEADTVSCSRDDTNYSFFASQHREVVSVTVKKLGEENIEFEVPSNKLRKEVVR
jgi:hypothetical protein